MSNPALNQIDNYEKLENQNDSYMTASGALTKLLILGVIMIIPALITWNWAALGAMDRVSMMMTIGLISGFILSMIIIFAKRTAPFLSPLYALSEGMFLGGISAMYELRTAGIAIQAIALTFLTAFAMAFLYKSRIIQATAKFRATLLIAMTSILALYLTSIIASFLGFNMISSFLAGSSPLSIGVSIVICLVAAFNLIWDFDYIERLDEAYAPKYMEWYSAFSLLLTIVWLYLEILRLLSKRR